MINKSLRNNNFLSDWYLRLVVQRTKINTESGEQLLPGLGYIYRVLLTNDHESTEEEDFTNKKCIDCYVKN